MAQVFLDAQAEHGDMSSWNIVSSPSMNAQQADEALKDFAHTYLFPYLKVVEDCDSGSKKRAMCDYPWTHWNSYTSKSTSEQQNDNNDYRFIVNNRIIYRLIYDNNNGVFGSGIFVWVDINGSTGPNVIGEDIFCMYMSKSKKRFEFLGAGNSRENLLYTHQHRCAPTNGLHSGKTCGALIQMDGWQIKPDYPYFK